MTIINTVFRIHARSRHTDWMWLKQVRLDAWHRVSISYMWNEGEHQNGNNNKCVQKMEKQKIYELIIIMMAQEKWQWISSRSKEKRGKEWKKKRKTEQWKQKHFNHMKLKFFFIKITKKEVMRIRHKWW